MSKIKYSDSEISDLLDGIFAGDITEYSLPDNLYFAIADYLKKGLYEGFGKSIAEFDGDDVALGLLSELRNNIYAFSGAKTFQQVREMVDLLTDDAGKIRTFSAFKTDALDIYQTYNIDWLQTERSTALGQASNAAKWQQIVKDKKTFPLLRYSAIEDATTSDICAPLDGIVLPVNDPFWDEFMPLNHFNCRCLVTQIADGELEATDPDELDGIAAGPRELIKPLFAENPGKTGEVFNKEHPYFDVPKADKKYAKENFNLDIPEND